MLFTDSCWLMRQACNYSQFRKNRILALGHRQFIDHQNLKIDALSINMKYVQALIVCVVTICSNKCSCVTLMYYLITLIKGVVHCVPRVGQNCAQKAPRNICLMEM